MPWQHPRPPRGWRPAPGLPTIGTFLGLTIGTALDASLNYLWVNNYGVLSYDNSAVIVQNVPMMNFMWPQGRLMYNNGLLYGSQFYYPTVYYDPGRYNSIYNSLCYTYGAPVAAAPLSPGGYATWYGANGGFITLRLEPVVAPNGAVEYYTILSLGN